LWEKEKHLVPEIHTFCFEIMYMRYTPCVEEMTVLLVTNIDAYVDFSFQVSDVRHVAP
jgi:hypothetical protein